VDRCKILFTIKLKIKGGIWVSRTRIENMLLGIAGILFGLALSNLVPEDGKIYGFIASLIGFIRVVISYLKKD
jgi:uncharacterized membrane protein YeaQ/YmgE (transglycosylase-associated protein family)